ncbi:MAG: hypothetical protein EHM35_16915, partial [Planctomycetaceae bacterium]
MAIPVAVPLIASAVASIGSALLKNRAQNNATQANADLYNNWMKQYQQTGQNLFGQAQAAGWNPFGAKTSTSQGQNFSQGGGSYSNRPVITGEYQPLDALMRGIMTNRLSSGS